MGTLHFTAPPQRGQGAGHFYRRNGHPEMSFRFCGERIASRATSGCRKRSTIWRAAPTGWFSSREPPGREDHHAQLPGGPDQQRTALQDRHDRRSDRIRPREQTGHRCAAGGADGCPLVQSRPDPCPAPGSRCHRRGGNARSRSHRDRADRGGNGHLVLATMHSPSVSHAIERIIGVFDGNAQRQVVLQLSNALQGIIAQDLLPRPIARGGSSPANCSSPTELCGT